jgi:hypothetical protein
MAPLKPHERSWPTLSEDTDPEAERVQMEIYRRMSPAQKLALVFEANAQSRALALAGLRLHHPEAFPEEIERRYKGLMLGEELATEVYGPLPGAA